MDTSAKFYFNRINNVDSSLSIYFVSIKGINNHKQAKNVEMMMKKHFKI